MDANETNTNATTEEERVLQLKSSHIYRKSYDTFMSWRSKNKISSFSEDILLSYFNSLKFKPSTLWAEYSKLKSTLSVYNKTDISKYRKLLDWLKTNSDGFEAKKAKTFTQEELNRFIMEAPDLDYLQIKVAVIFGIMGACGRQELQKLECENVIDTQNTLIVNIMKAEKLDRTFAISGEHYHICKKYMNLRPKCDNRRFFITYSKGRCGNQNIGINKFGAMGKLVAKVLKLPNPELYTGHCFRRTSMNLSDEGDNLLKMRGWQTAVAEQCNETNRRTTRSSKIEVNNSLASEKLGLEKDVENWMKFKLLGGKLFLKKDVVPHFFECQNRMVPIKPSSAVLERQRREILESIENTPDTTLESLEVLEIKETHDDDAQTIPKFSDKCIQAALYPHKRSKQVQVDMRGPQNIVTLPPKRVDLRNRTTLPVKLIVVLILGIKGACRAMELTNITTNNMEFQGDIVIFKLSDKKNKTERSFVIRDELFDILKKYVSLRPENTLTDRLFLNYRDGKCTRQVIGRHKILSMPKQIANFLNLPNPHLYTGHCFRRTSKTLEDEDNLLVKRYGGKTEKVTDGMVDPNDKRITINIMKTENNTAKSHGDLYTKLRAGGSRDPPDFIEQHTPPNVEVDVVWYIRKFTILIEG